MTSRTGDVTAGLPERRRSRPGASAKPSHVAIQTEPRLNVSNARRLLRFGAGERYEWPFMGRKRHHVASLEARWPMDTPKPVLAYNTISVRECFWPATGIASLAAERRLPDATGVGWCLPDRRLAYGEMRKWSLAYGRKRVHGIGSRDPARCPTVAKRALRKFLAVAGVCWPWNPPPPGHRLGSDFPGRGEMVELMGPVTDRTIMTGHRVCSWRLGYWLTRPLRRLAYQSVHLPCPQARYRVVAQGTFEGPPGDEPSNYSTEQECAGDRDCVLQ